MDKDTVFVYSYSGEANSEVQAIRKKYLREESKLDELKRLDREVQEAGTLLSLVLGIGGALVFGLGMCMTMDIVGGGMILGVLIGIIGAAAMIAAYPAGRKQQNTKKSEHSSRILQLTEELMLEEK